MPGLALLLWALFGLVAMLGRIVVHRRRTGSSGVHVGHGSSRLEWVAGVFFVGGIAVAVISPALELANAIESVEALDTGAVAVVGLVLYGLGFAVTVIAQAAMGASWRIGVDSAEHTELVTGGPFALVRNPIFSGMIPAIAGLALISPAAPALAGAVSVAVGIEMQVRAVEEPYLRREHGDAYAAYAARVGRFVPGLGKLSGS